MAAGAASVAGAEVESVEAGAGSGAGAEAAGAGSAGAGAGAGSTGASSAYVREMGSANCAERMMAIARIENGFFMLVYMVMFQDPREKPSCEKASPENGTRVVPLTERSKRSSTC